MENSLTPARGEKRTQRDNSPGALYAPKTSFIRHNQTGMSWASRAQYYRRILGAYLTPGTSQLTFWHDEPERNFRATGAGVGPYYMRFQRKADYAGPHDTAGIPMLDYRGHIGRQYNPIAIAQWGLGNFDLYEETGDAVRRQKFMAAADWLRDNLEQNHRGVWVWNHHFDWEYRTPLKAPWYSGLAQGQGISLLLRAHRATKDESYMQAAVQAFVAFQQDVADGGVALTDARGNLWFEEYIVSPPTHILNGFLWASWGVYDYWLATNEIAACELFDRVTKTIAENLHNYDLGFWSLYEQSGTKLPMVASPFYHRLHIVQLQIMHEMTGRSVFREYSERWQGYEENPAGRARALCYKSVFKLCYY